MDLSKSYEFLQPEKVTDRIHLIGCGSVGSTLAELLARAGFTKITLYDFDTVEAHNLANQMFVQSDVHRPKVEAVSDRILAINPLAAEDLKLRPKGWTGQKLNGYVFLAVDNIDLRRKIAEENKNNPFVKAMFDFRTRLVDAQHYAADWKNPKHVENFIGSMNFSHEEAKKETPVSACNVELSVAPTVWNACIAGVCNFMRFVKGEGIKNMVLVNPFNFDSVGI